MKPGAAKPGYIPRARTQAGRDQTAIVIENTDVERLRETLAKLERELEQSRRAERRLALRDAVTRALADSGSLVEATPRILQALCEALDWDLGALWIVEPHTDQLRCVQTWHLHTGPASAFEFDTRQSRFQLGEGLPGRVWATGQPAWILDITKDDNFRAPSANGAGLKASVAFPISAGRQVLGVMEFFSADVRKPDSEVIRLLSALGSQMGQFVERKYAEETLDRFFTLSIDMLCIAGFDGFYKRLNPAWERTLGYTVAELMAVPFVDFVHPDDREATLAETARLATGSDTISFENRYRAKDGSYRWLLWTAAPFADYRLIYAAARDITERKRTEAKVSKLREDAEAATHAKSEFLARMSHEIRTPLNVVLGMGDLLERTALNADQRQYVRVLGRAGSNLLTLINDILDISKAESGRISLEDIAFELPEAIEGAVEMMAARASEKGLDLTYHIAPGTPVLLTGDPGRLRQILINLLSNAIKFTAKGSVRIDVRRDPDSPDPGALEFAVSDTGIGISHDQLESIFEAFTQADVSTTRHYGGTGLGLSISKRLVELMQGRIQAESEPSKGTTIRFTAKFGAGAELGAAAERLAEARSITLPASALHILIVDDSEENRFLLSEYLKDFGCKLSFAEDGRNALERFCSATYDLVFMDLQMPVMDGYESTRRMRAWERTNRRPATPILALTASALEAEAQAALDAGCNACLRKPIRMAALLEAVGKYAAKPVAGDGAPSQRILVRADARLRAVIPGYLANRRADVSAIAEALDRSDFRAIRAVGHKMTGTGLGYGFPRISEIGVALERAAKESNAAEIRTQAAELARFIDRVEVVGAET